MSKLRYQAIYRGTKELELIFRAFLDQYGNTLSATDIDELQAILDLPDDLLGQWLIHGTPTPQIPASPMAKRLYAFVRNR